MGFKLEDIGACSDCGQVYLLTALQIVKRIVSKKGATILGFYCPAHLMPYDTLTTTSGYFRYYLNDKEVADPMSASG